MSTFSLRTVYRNRYCLGTVKDIETCARGVAPPITNSAHHSAHQVLSCLWLVELILATSLTSCHTHSDPVTASNRVLPKFSYFYFSTCLAAIPLNPLLRLTFLDYIFFLSAYRIARIVLQPLSFDFIL